MNGHYVTGKARPAAIRAAATARLDGAGGVVSREHPGVFLQGLDVYGRRGVGLYKAEMPRDVVAEAFAEIYGAGGGGGGEGGGGRLDTHTTSMALTAFCGDECATLAAAGSSTHPTVEPPAAAFFFFFFTRHCLQKPLSRHQSLTV